MAPFELLAKVMYDSMPGDPPRGSIPTKRQAYRLQYSQWRYDVDQIAEVGFQTDSNFPKEQFLAACGVQS